MSVSYGAATPTPGPPVQSVTVVNNRADGLDGMWQAADHTMHFTVAPGHTFNVARAGTAPPIANIQIRDAASNRILFNADDMIGRRYLGIRFYPGCGYEFLAPVTPVAPST